MTKEAENHKTETISLVVPSNPKFLYVIRSAMYPVILEAGFSKKEARLLILALDEACSNIIKYAYEGDTTKPISVTATIMSGEFRLELRDTGKKADVSKIAPRDLADVRPGGLGTHFMNVAFDSVKYDVSGREGTLLTLMKKRP